MVVAIGPKDVGLWLDFLEQYAPSQLDNVRRITLYGGPNRWNCFKEELVDIRNRVPKLEAIGFQTQDSWRRWVPDYINPRIERAVWDNWGTVNSFRIFDPSVTVALEMFVYIKGCHYEGPGGWSSKEKQIVVRIVKKGKEHAQEGKRKAGEGKDGWGPDDTQVELVNPGRLLAKAKNAPWKAWWQGGVEI